jgi:hypothetical protein
VETNYHVVRLSNNLNLVGDVEYTAEGICIKFPLEVTAKPINDDTGKIIGEHMVLRPFLVMTDDREVVVDLFNVVCMNSLSQRLSPSYEEMVENVYGKVVAFDGDFYKEEKDSEAKEVKDLSVEEAEYLQEQLQQFISDDDKVIH